MRDRLRKPFGAPVVATAVLAVAIAIGIGVALSTQLGRSDKTSGDDARAADSADASPPEASLPPTPAASHPAYPDIAWQTLLPKGWDPMAPFKGLRLDQLDDGDPRAQVALYQARKYWKTAPTEPTLDGKPVRLPGYVVSLDGEGEAIREFLLVPYFGACIHVPPPPANQIVHVRAQRPLPGLRTMDTVWIQGVMRIERAETMFGAAGYAMREAVVERYVP